MKLSSGSALSIWMEFWEYVKYTKSDAVLIQLN